MKVAARLAIGVLVFLILTILLVPLAGRYFGTNIRALEMATALEPQFFLAALVLFLLAICTRKRAVIALAGGVLLFHGVLVLPWYFGKNEGSGEPLKVVSFNVLGNSRKYAEAIEWVKKEDPQIAVFQEVVSPWDKELQKLRAIFPHHYRVAEMQMDVFSKLPIERPYFEKFGPARGYICFQVNMGGPITIYATHTYPQIYFGMEGFRYHRDHLIKGLPTDIVKHSGQLIVVLGDLNSTMWSPHYLTLIRQTGLKNARKGFGLYPSLGDEKNWQPWTAVAFDHCLVSKDIGVEEFRTGPFLGSDHLPVVAMLRVPRRPEVSASAAGP
jgi:endonuclease/exonuclease/phosphatase (EEP) superfamily protein YafD